MTNPNWRPSRSDRVLAQQTSGLTVLLDPDSGEYFSLDEISGRIWELCDGQRSIVEIASVLAAEYDAPVPRIEADVVALVDDLAASALMQRNA